MSVRLTPSDRSLPIALLRAREVVMARFRPILASHGVTEQQWRVLRVLQEDGPQDATEISRRAFILAPSLTRILRTLEDQKLISRRADREDARRQRINLTQKGRRLIDQVTPQSLEIYERITAEFGEEKLKSLLDLLGELAQLELQKD